MKIAQLNMVHNGSTGKIMLGIAEVAREQGYEAITISPRYYQRGKRLQYPEFQNHEYFGSWFGNMLHLRAAQLTGLLGCFSIFDTRGLLRKLDAFKPDVLHLHNLHNSTVNFPMLFSYIKKNRIRVVWTLHDCWAFTGKCPYFDIVACEKWKTGCSRCPQLAEYPKAFVDRSRLMWKLKKRWFTGIENMTLVTPSNWLADLVKQSFLKEYPVKVINNGIDLNVFKPTESCFREKYGIPQNKFIVLGVAFGWGRRKGLDVFIELAKRLDERFQIVLVGTDHNADKQLPDNIISIHRTENQQQLAELYTAADVFVNPTREEVLGLVNIEANACGIPVLTFDTGGSPECISEKSGCVVEKDDVDALEREILRICVEKPYSRETCVSYAKRFDMYNKFGEYVELYGSFLELKN